MPWKETDLDSPPGNIDEPVTGTLYPIPPGGLR
jgi:hypothetical protein